jgi:RHS repeat-associated protein
LATGSYAYAGGFLESVTHVDSSVTTVSYTAAGNGLVAMEIYDPVADEGHRRKTVYVTGSSAVVGSTVVPTSMGLVRAIENNEGELAFVSMATGNDGQAMIYEGGGRLKLDTSTYEDVFDLRYYESGWTVGQSWGVTGQLESVGPKFQFSGMITEHHNEDGTTTQYEYDGQDRVIYIKYDDDTFESFCYDGTVGQNVSRYRDRTGDVTVSTYDSNGNRLTQEVGLHDHSTNTGEIDPYTGLLDYDRCASNDVQTAAYALMQWSYSGGRLSKATDGNGNETDYEYNLDGLLKKIVQPPDVTSGTRPEIEFTYDSFGRVKKQIDAYDEETEYFYDSRGRRISTLYADGTSEQSIFGTSGSGAGLMIKTIDRNGIVTTYAYDNAERLVSKVTAAAKIVSNTEVSTPEVAIEETWAYLHGTAQPITHRRAGALTEMVYDYRGRVIESHVYPRSGTELVQTRTFNANQLFSTEDPYGRKTYYAYDATDGRLIRSVVGTVPSFSLANPSAVITLTRDSSANADYIITDSIFDADGKLVEAIDPRSISSEYEYDARGRETAQIAAAGTSISVRTETDYDDNSNVVEVRSPRYFDSNDTAGYQKSKETWTYNGRSLVASHTEAPGTTESATESYTYDLRGRQVTHVDFAGKTWTTHYEDCCGHVVGSENPLGDGTLASSDAGGRVVHQTTVEDVTTHFGALDNPIDAKTYREVTTRYDGRGRPIARTTWLTARSTVDVSSPPIAGADSVPAADGLTEQFLYDDNLNDAAGLDSSGGLTPLIGSTAISLSAALTKLADTEANGGAGIVFSTDAPGSARVSINAEQEIHFTIADGMGRTVMSGVLDDTSALLTWNCSVHDATESVTGYGTVLVSKNVNALGDTTKQLTDAAGRTLRSIDALGKITAGTFDAAGNQLSIRDPNNVGQDCVYDALGRDTQCTDTSSAVTNSSYDAAGNRISTTDGKTQVTNYVFDARGRQIEQIDRLSGSTEFAYTATSQLASLTDAENQTTSYTYDDAGNKLTETYPDHVTSSTVGQTGYGIVSFTYDPAGRVDVRSDQQGDTCTYAYDLAGRLSSRSYAGLSGGPLSGQSYSDTFTYDDASRMLTAVSGGYSNTVTYTYDDAGRKATEAITISGQTYTTAISYNAAGQLTGYTYPDGTAVGRSYTDRGQLYQLTHASSTIDTRTYDDGGRMTGSSYNNGVSESRSYNNDNTLASISFSGAAIGTYSYGWDSNKNKTSESITGTMSGYGFAVGSSGYDSEDRLINWERSDSNLDQSWDLSLVGDWDSITENSSTQNRTHGPTHELLSAGGQSLAHDTKGNMTLIPAVLRDGTNSLTLKWDFENKLTTADVGSDSTIDVTYKWDALGRRVYRDDGTTATVYVQAGQQTIADYTAGTAASSPKYRYVYASYIDEPVIRVEPAASETLYFHRNQQYSIIALTDDTGAVEERYAYSAYGEPVFTNASGMVLSDSAEDNRYTYTGREWDADLALYHFRARMYDPESGRFLGRDPIGYRASLNLYQVVDGHSLSYVDPTGLTGRATTRPVRANPDDSTNPVSGKCVISFECARSPWPGYHCGIRLEYTDESGDPVTSHLHAKGLYAEGGRANGCKIRDQGAQAETDYTIRNSVEADNSVCQCIANAVNAYNQFMQDNDNYEVFPSEGDECGSRPGCNSNYAARCVLNKCGVSATPGVHGFLPGWNHRMRKCSAVKRSPAIISNTCWQPCKCKAWSYIDEGVCGRGMGPLPPPSGGGW